MQGMRRQNQKEIAPEEWEEQQAVIWLLQGEEEKEEGTRGTRRGRGRGGGRDWYQEEG